MKKTLVAIAALAAFGAQAQSTATIDGTVNYGVANSVAKQATVGGWKGDRNVLNFKVTEDMGSGNKLGLLLQSRFNSGNAGMNTGYVNSATGAAGDNVFEQSKVTIDSAYGQVAVGRFTNAQGVADLHPFEDAAQSTASHQAVNGRHSGQFQFTTPSFGGAQLWLLNAKASSNKYLGAGTGGGYSNATDLSAANGSTYKADGAMHRDLSAIGVNYNNGPWFVQANSMTDLTNVRSTKIGATYTAATFKLYANQYNQKDNLAFFTPVAAGYTFSGTTGLAVANTVAATGTGTGMAAHKATELAVKVPYGQFNFMLGRLTSNADLKLGETTPGASKVTKTAYGVTYDITKRTQLQAYASTTKNGDSSATGATVNNAGFANGHNSFFGMQHSF